MRFWISFVSELFKIFKKKFRSVCLLAIVLAVEVCCNAIMSELFDCWKIASCDRDLNAMVLRLRGRTIES